MTPEFINDCIARALRHESGLDQSALEVPGFSTGTIRRLWNNLAAGATAYLEVGAYFGGTACAAINNNRLLRAVIYEDGSQEFHGRPILDELTQNVMRHANGADWEIHPWDFFREQPYSIAENSRRFDFYFFDGNHAREFQAKALPHAFPALADRFLFAVDDYNWESVNLGTDEGFGALAGKVQLVQKWILSGEKKQDDPIYHNGVALFLCEKV